MVSLAQTFDGGFRKRGERKLVGTVSPTVVGIVVALWSWERVISITKAVADKRRVVCWKDKHLSTLLTRKFLSCTDTNGNFAARQQKEILFVSLFTYRKSAHVSSPNTKIRWKEKLFLVSLLRVMRVV